RLLSSYQLLDGAGCDCTCRRVPRFRQAGEDLCFAAERRRQPNPNSLQLQGSCEGPESGPEYQAAAARHDRRTVISHLKMKSSERIFVGLIAPAIMLMGAPLWSQTGNTDSQQQPVPPLIGTNTGSAQANSNDESIPANSDRMQAPPP